MESYEMVASLVIFIRWMPSLCVFKYLPEKLASCHPDTITSLNTSFASKDAAATSISKSVSNRFETHGRALKAFIDARDPRTDTTKKTKKQKRNTTLNKLGKDANLTAQVDRANLTAGIMHLLLTTWKYVVKQLQHIHGTSSSQSRSISRPKHDLNNAGMRIVSSILWEY